MPAYRSRKCSQGMICIENATISFIFIIIAVIFLFHYKWTREKIIINENIQPNLSFFPFNMGTGLREDVLRNPYSPPLKDESIYLNPSYNIPINSVPINIPTNSYDTTYRQVGILSSEKNMNGEKSIIPLMGRPINNGRDKWQFYSITNNNVKIPISNKTKSCTNEYGCDNLYNGDTVYAEGYDDVFKVTMYENDTLRYIPYV